MSEKKVKSRVIHKHDTEENWLKATTFTPLMAELIVYDVDDTYDYERFKLGDGTTLVNDLPFVTDNFASAELVNIQGQDIEALKQQVADLMYEPIAISEFTNSVGAAEKGSTVTSVTFNWKTNKTPTSILLSGTALDVNTTSHTLTDLALTSKQIYALVAFDERESSAVANSTVNFYNGVYYGALAGDAVIDNAAILSLTKSLQSTKRKTITVTAGEGEYIVYALPSSYGTPTFNIGGFDTTFDLKATFDFTNASGYTEAYNVYFSPNANYGTAKVAIT